MVHQICFLLICSRFCLAEAQEGPEIARAVLLLQSDGGTGSDSNVNQHCDEIYVKEELPDAAGSDSSVDEAGRERLTRVALKQEVPVSILFHL
jgi:hypothetical protein